MANLYRKSVIDRLSSPEQLDRMIVIASPQLWLAALCAAVITVVALIWSIVGRLPSKVDANGIFVSDQGVTSVYADVSGTVDTLSVAEGDTVQAGQLILSVSSEDTQKQIDDLTQRIAKVEAVTLTSSGDEANADTQQLLNLKTRQHQRQPAGRYACKISGRAERPDPADRSRQGRAGLCPRSVLCFHRQNRRCGCRAELFQQADRLQ